ncbi:MAG: PilN domain-containing protein [Nitrospiraceae bacterium]|nr:MAG: PilN domain-containing protein [Nitrospiraceae bacterium]UCH45883.1 MAG: PilN domain-containing protein [Nitrospiraceae bacterium]
MIRINLLPSAKRKADIIPPVFIYGGIAAVLILILMIVGMFIINSRISGVQNEIAVKQQKLNQLKTKLEEVKNYERNNEEVRAKAEVIEKLKKNQVVPLRLLDEVSEMLPKGVWLTALLDKNGTISIDGYAYSNTELVSYVQNLKSSTYLTEVMLVESRQTEVGTYSIYKFKLQFRMKI